MVTVPIAVARGVFPAVCGGYLVRIDFVDVSLRVFEWVTRMPLNDPVCLWDTDFKNGL